MKLYLDDIHFPCKVEHMTPQSATYAHLAPNPKSAYKQLFIKGTRIRAEVVYGMTVDGSEPMTPEQARASPSNACFRHTGWRNNSA